MDDGLLVEIEALYRRRFDAFVGAAVRVVGDRELGREAVQEAFAAAVRGRRRFREESSLETWVWRVVINTARTLRRRVKNESRLFEALQPSVNGSGAAHVGDRLAIAVAALPERQRLMLFLRYYADLDYRTIAEVLEVEVGTVSATLHAARARLRETLAGVDA